MLVREVMTTPVVTLPAEQTVKQAVHVLYERDIAADRGEERSRHERL